MSSEAQVALACAGEERALSHWLGALRRYLAFTALANLGWEFLHMPLYTIWWSGTWGEIIFAALHCTGGDILIATASLVLALLLLGERDWPARGSARVGATTILFGVCYTVFSEWLNIVVRAAWAYSELMPVIPLAGLDVGLSPLLQWIVIPLLAFRFANRRAALYPLRTNTA